MQLDHQGELHTHDIGRVCDECRSSYVTMVCCACGLFLCSAHEGCPDCESDEHLLNILPIDEEIGCPT